MQSYNHLWLILFNSFVPQHSWELRFSSGTFPSWWKWTEQREKKQINSWFLKPIMYYLNLVSNTLAVSLETHPNRMEKYAIGMPMNGFKRRKKWIATTTIFGSTITKSGFRTWFESTASANRCIIACVKRSTYFFSQINNEVRYDEILPKNKLSAWLIMGWWDEFRNLSNFFHMPSQIPFFWRIHLKSHIIRHMSRSHTRDFGRLLKCHVCERNVFFRLTSVNGKQTNNRMATTSAEFSKLNVCCMDLCQKRTNLKFE